jgi:hypothetical protein
MADEDLSDEQLRQLLKDAEHRLRNRGKQQSQVSSLSHIQTRYASVANHPPRIWRACYRQQNFSSIPKIASTTLIEPYVKTTPQGAQVDRSHLVTLKERKLANGMRVVEDPVAIKEKAIKVRYFIVNLMVIIFYEENLSQKNMTQNVVPSWYRPAQNDFLYIHSYAEKKPDYMFSFKLLSKHC